MGDNNIIRRSPHMFSSTSISENDTMDNGAVYCKYHDMFLDNLAFSGESLLPIIKNRNSIEYRPAAELARGDLLVQEMDLYSTAVLEQSFTHEQLALLKIYTLENETFTMMRGLETALAMCFVHLAYNRKNVLPLCAVQEPYVVGYLLPNILEHAGYSPNDYTISVNTGRKSGQINIGIDLPEEFVKRCESVFVESLSSPRNDVFALALFSACAMTTLGNKKKGNGKYHVSQPDEADLIVFTGRSWRMPVNSKYNGRNKSWRLDFSCSGVANVYCNAIENTSELITRIQTIPDDKYSSRQYIRMENKIYYKHFVEDVYFIESNLPSECFKLDDGPVNGIHARSAKFSFIDMKSLTTSRKSNEDRTTDRTQRRNGLKKPVERAKESQTYIRPVPLTPRMEQGHLEERNIMSRENTIVTPAGIMPCSHLNVGDEVIDSNNSLTRVSDITRISSYVNMVDLTVHHSSHIHVTPDCNLFTIDASYILHGKNKTKEYISLPSLKNARWKRAGDIEQGDWLVSRESAVIRNTGKITFDLADHAVNPSRYDIKDNSIIWHCHHTRKGRDYDGIRIKDVSENTGISRKRVSEILNGRKAPATPEERIAIKSYLGSIGWEFDCWRNKVSTIEDIVLPRYIHLGKSFSYILGFYVADGSIHQGCVQFSLDKSKPEEINAVSAAMSKLLPGIAGYISQPLEDGLGILYSFSCPPLASLIKEIVPETVRDKKVPEILMTSNDDEIASAFIRGYIDGDGSIKSGRLAISTVSTTLAFQMQELLGRYRTYAYAVQRTIRNTNGTISTIWQVTAPITNFVAKIMGVDANPDLQHDTKVVELGNGFIARKVFKSELVSVNDVSSFSLENDTSGIMLHGAAMRFDESDKRLITDNPIINGLNHDDHDTFVSPDTLVLSTDGYKTISAIKPGDDIIGQSGKVARVTNVKRHQPAHIIQIKSKNVVAKIDSNGALFASKCIRPSAHYVTGHVDSTPVSPAQYIPVSNLGNDDWILFGASSATESNTSILLDLSTMIPQGDENRIEVLNDKLLFRPAFVRADDGQYPFWYPKSMSKGTGLTVTTLQTIHDGQRKPRKKSLDALLQYLSDNGKTFDDFIEHFGEIPPIAIPRYVELDEKLAYIAGFFSHTGTFMSKGRYINYAQRATTITDTQRKISDIVYQVLNIEPKIFSYASGGKSSVHLNWSCPILYGLLDYLIGADRSRVWSVPEIDGNEALEAAYIRGALTPAFPNQKSISLSFQDKSSVLRVKAILERNGYIQCAAVGNGIKVEVNCHDNPRLHISDETEPFQYARRIMQIEEIDYRSEDAYVGLCVDGEPGYATSVGIIPSLTNPDGLKSHP